MTCDFCEKPAVRNYQRIWVSWKVERDEQGVVEYSEEPRLELDIQEPVGEYNVHLCEDHEQPWLDGEL